MVMILYCRSKLETFQNQSDNKMNSFRLQTTGLARLENLCVR